MEKKWSTDFISAAFLGTSLLGIIEGLLGNEPLTYSLQISLYAFALSIPLLAFAVLMPGHTTYYFGDGVPGYRRNRIHIIIVELVGWSASIVGLVAIIWHLSQLAAYIFLGSAFFALAVFILIPLFVLFLSSLHESVISRLKR